MVINIVSFGKHLKEWTQQWQLMYHSKDTPVYQLTLIQKTPLFIN